MPYVTNSQNDDKSYASAGVGTAALIMSIFGAAGAAGLLNGGLGNIFGGNQNPSASPVYQLSQKDNEIALLKAQQYSDNKTFALAERVANLETKVVAIETAAPLRDKILSDSILSLQRQMSEISVRRVPNYVLDPGYGPAFVAPMPPPGYAVQPIVQNGTTTTPASSTSNQS